MTARVLATVESQPSEGPHHARTVGPLDQKHDLAVIASADWVIDLGPGGGENGGKVVAAGPPERVATARSSRTAPYLREHLERIRRATSAA